MNSNQIMLGFYGDDFTGSTDAMEALTLSGIRTVLFLKPPTKELINESFSDIQAFGIAGVGRSLNPDQMEVELRRVFQSLKDSGAQLLHYKTCSTFDSSPELGSIGKATEIGREELGFNQAYIPLVVGVPSLKRYTVFGNHYATVNGETYRLDRHPIMSKHPITPMNEADLLRYLDKQTQLRSTVVNILELTENKNLVQETIAKKKQDHDIILFDVLDKERLQKVGEIILDEAKNGPLFMVGSSGIEYALTAAWRKRESNELTNSNFLPVGIAEPMLVVSGSCSEVTKGQLEYAMENGFTGIRVSSEDFMEVEQLEEARDRLVEQASSLLSKGENVIIYSALGPDDPSIEITKRRLTQIGKISTDTGKFLGEQMGKVTKQIIQQEELSRLVVAGGDTSGYVIKELEVYAMEVIMPITPGGPLCRAYSESTKFNGLELCLKGGQVGSQEFFVDVKNGE